MNNHKKVILASSSPFRRELLARLGLEFSSVSPEIDESPQDNEQPEAMVTRLAQQKAEKIAENNDNAIIIASDQAACLDEEILGKPHTHERAIAQLDKMRGNTVRFVTSLYVMDTRTQKTESRRVVYPVTFRDYNDEEIERYLRVEKPYQCAGSFKSEKLGISLVNDMTGPDPTALIGLPLIELSKILRKFGLQIP